MNTISTKKKVFAAVLASALALGVSGSAMAANDKDANPQGTPTAQLTTSVVSIDTSKLSPEELAKYEKMSKDFISLDNVSIAIASTEALQTIEAGDEIKDLPEGVIKMDKVDLGEGESAAATTMAVVIED